MLGIGVELAIGRRLWILRFHPLRWDRWWDVSRYDDGGIIRLAFWTVEWLRLD